MNNTPLFLLLHYQVVQRRGSKLEQRLNMEIGNLISKHLQEFDNMRDPEITAFRRDILTLCQV